MGRVQVRCPYCKRLEEWVHVARMPVLYTCPHCLSNAFDRLSNHFGFCLSVCPSTDRLSNDYVRNSLPIFTKFCMPLENLIVSKAIVSETNRK